MTAPSSSAPDDLERRKVEVEEGKLKLERSFPKTWGPLLITALVTGAVTVGVALLTHLDGGRLADQQRAIADVNSKQKEGQWGISVLQLYVTHPEAFDLVKAPDIAGNNLNALASSAPEVMKPILLHLQDQYVADSVRKGGPINASALDAVATAVTQAGGGPKVSNSATPPGWPPGVNPANYSVYIQYGANAKATATSLGDRLRADGFRIPDLESVSETPSRPEVRYYRPDQLAVADALVNRLGNAARAEFVGEGKNPPDGIIEIWLPATG